MDGPQEIPDLPDGYRATWWTGATSGHVVLKLMRGHRYVCAGYGADDLRAQALRWIAEDQECPAPA